LIETVVDGARPLDEGGVMKAVRIQTPATIETLRHVDMADPPPPGPGQIQVRLRASSLNNHDASIVSGKSPTADGRIPLSDGAGEVVAVGEGVRGFAPGDLVVSTFFTATPSGVDIRELFASVPGDGVDGYACELATAHYSAFTHAPRGWSAAEAATVTCAGLTAWRALVVDGGLKPGATVLVQGTGGVSLYALQIAKAAGCTVIATSSSDEKLERLKALGADHVINYRSEPNWGAAAFAWTGGKGVDHVVEIGGSGTIPQSLTACGFGGHVAVVGALAGFGGVVPTVLVMVRQIRMIGLLVGDRSQQIDFIRALEVNEIRPVIDSHYPLADLSGAFTHHASGRHFGKIVVDI
jgi:NADPH:quinone reductase-like Zn-dependent oxidoreductase